VIGVTDSNIPIVTIKSEVGCDRFIPKSFAAKEWERIAPQDS
jgi:hypothetical protein